MLKRFILLLLLVGCSLTPGNLKTKQANDLSRRQIRRIAILPVKNLAGQPTSPGSPAKPEIEIGLTETFYDAMYGYPNWQLISKSELSELEKQPLSTVTESLRARKLGERSFADGVLSGRLLRYRERVGGEYGAKSPASVYIVLELIDVRRGDIAWSATFDETQRPLSENILILADVKQRGIKWLSAEELARAGIQKAVGQLHKDLFN